MKNKIKLDLLKKISKGHGAITSKQSLFAPIEQYKIELDELYDLGCINNSSKLSCEFEPKLIYLKNVKLTANGERMLEASIIK